MSSQTTDPGDGVLISYTLFRTTTPTSKSERDDVEWREFVARIQSAAIYIDKQHCPLISLSEYGDLLSPKGCIRHAANVRRVFGGEFDYDGEKVSIVEAAQRLSDARIKAVLYTSPSHKPNAPRWRVLLPFSEPALAEKRAEYVARANRVLGGIASRESFTLSQSFYIGRVKGVTYEVVQTQGRCIDLAADLDPLYHVDARNDGESKFDSTTDEELREAFDRGENRYQAMLKLSSRWASRGQGVDDITSNLYTLLGENGTHNTDGVDLRTRVQGLAESAVQKFFDTRAQVKQFSTEETKTSFAEPKPLVMSGFTVEEVLGPIEPERMLLPGIPAEAYTLVAGGLSSFKTTLLLYLLVWKATGWDILGLDQESGGCDIGKALLVTYEDTDRRIFAKLQRVIQDGYRVIASRYGEEDARVFVARAAQNLRRIVLTGDSTRGLVQRVAGSIAPNEAFVAEIAQAVRSFAPEGALIGIDPLRLAIVGSQNDDDGADVVVHTLNRLAGAVPGSGVVACSHSNKSGAKEGVTDGYADAAYATSGSALYSQHARSNFQLARLTSEQIKTMFSRHAVPEQEIGKQAVVKLTHGRLSHGAEQPPVFLLQRNGTLLRVHPIGDQTATDLLHTHGVTVLDAIICMQKDGIRVSKKLLEHEPQLKKALGRDKVRYAITLLEGGGYLEVSGRTKDMKFVVTTAGERLLDNRDRRRESEKGSDQ